MIALVPPVDGIKATLSSSGISRAVKGDTFETVVIRRDPESVALSAPLNATGIFNLQNEGDMLFPFEATGVDTTWGFSLPKPANLGLDYGNIADVLFTIQYTALNSSSYRENVTQRLGTTFNSNAAFSFRNDFQDQWYELHNPQQSDNPMAVRFPTTSDDFSANLVDLKIKDLILYFSRKEGQSEVTVKHLQFTEEGSSGFVGGGASSLDGVIGTRRGNASSWMSMVGRKPFGTWELAFPNDPETQRFIDEDIDDFIFVINYSARLPAWPS